MRPIASSRAIEPPPAPISMRSMTGTFSGMPDPCAKRLTLPASKVVACSGSPFSMRHILAVVPPMSNAMTEGVPVIRA